MLHIYDIKKKYVTGELIQTALDGVTLTLRDNEFVAILGPSGSGKTTLLNVIGGLDRYDSGDLIINGISTKKYTDRDWDSYRNHTVGFVFQSYNLIPHQTVLSNVELALTISGVSKPERRARAVRALEEVGLGDQLHKRPNQMSGGQMQRVAIARALVNNPDILLADEPTGALDSETSIQVMELLKEVSKNRLVVMVTHNPELAETYANRIVRVRDGRIVGDTNPYHPEGSDELQPIHKRMGKSSMSFLTALALSFNNLKTKKGRTILTSFAGSIGIIGIALILSLSTGFQKYIDKIQEETLSNYPLTIQSESTDLSALMNAYGSVLTAGQDAAAETVVEQQMLSQMFAQVNTNDLASFKEHLEDNADVFDPYVNQIRYHYGIKPLIYTNRADDGPVQVNPGTLFAQVTGMEQMSTFMDSDVFHEMLDNQKMLSSQYDVLKGRWPQDKDEMVIVLSSPHQISDYVAYTLGLKDPDSLVALMSQNDEHSEKEMETLPESWTYDDLMELEFRLIPASKKYRYNQTHCVWEDMSDDAEYMQEIFNVGLPLKIVGIVYPKEGASATLLSEGVAYTKELTEYVISQASKSTIVDRQLEDPDINVFTGKLFKDNGASPELDFNDMISVDSEKISSAFNMDVNTGSIAAMFESYLEQAYKSLNIDTEPAKNDFVSMYTELAEDMLRGYIAGNANSEGRAELHLLDAQNIVDSFINADSVSQRLSAMESAHGLPSDTLKQVYSPLLFGVISMYIADNVVLPDLPEIPDVPTISTEPESTLIPTETEVATEPVTESPTEVTLPLLTEPTDETLETSENLEEVPTAGSSDEPTESVKEELTYNNDQASTEEVSYTSSKDEYKLVFLTESTDEIPDQTEKNEVSDTVVEILETMYAPISLDDVPNAVSRFTATEAFGKTADVMSAAMVNNLFQRQLMEKISGFVPVVMNYIGSSVSVDEQMLASAFQFNLNEEELGRLMNAMSGSAQSTYESNLRKLGFADLNQPTSISLYFIDFEAKSEVLSLIDKYNERMSDEGKEDQIIQYTDMTGIMMSSVRTIIDSVSYVLIAFVAVSLVVSSIMIGIITYISVMERTKEIGVLRAIGASKNNISQVFNAETFIIGLCAGLIGVVSTLLLNIPINYIIHELTDNVDINASLPVGGAILLVILSMVLTLIGGLIPSKQAAKKDPVIALRSE